MDLLLLSANGAATGTPCFPRFTVSAKNVSTLNRARITKSRRTLFIHRCLSLKGDSRMQTFDLGRILAEREKNGQAWLEFLRAPSLSMGVYHLKVGQSDPQQPHTEDEVYYVVSGRAKFRTDGQEQVVGPGTLIFVGKAVEHRFYEISEDLTVLVVFAPPEGAFRKLQK